jgi:hypothetical protein
MPVRVFSPKTVSFDVGHALPMALMHGLIYIVKLVKLTRTVKRHHEHSTSRRTVRGMWAGLVGGAVRAGQGTTIYIFPRDSGARLVPVVRARPAACERWQAVWGRAARPAPLTTSINIANFTI